MRDNYLDFLRGLAVVSVVLIHTVFWSGEYYSSQTLRSLTLAFDVPFFFFLAGWSNSFHLGNIYRHYKGLFNIFLKWIFFISCVILFFICIGKNDLSGKEFLNSLFFNPKTTFFPVIAGSIWFLPVYFKVIMVNVIVLFFITMYDKDNKLLMPLSRYIYIYSFCIIFVFVSKISPFPVDNFFLFYSVFFLFGVIYGIKKYQIASFSSFAVKLLLLIVLVVFLAYLSSAPVFPMQNNKFPPNIVYLVYSMITILIAIYCKSFYHNRVCFINYIGKNAIWYYYTQGISSSLLFYCVPMVNVGWILKLLIMFILNLLMVIIIAEIFKRAYDMLYHFVITMIYKWKVKNCVHE